MKRYTFRMPVEIYFETDANTLEEALRKARDAIRALNDDLGVRAELPGVSHVTFQGIEDRVKTGDIIQIEEIE